MIPTIHCVGNRLTPSPLPAVCWCNGCSLRYSWRRRQTSHFYGDTLWCRDQRSQLRCSIFDPVTTTTLPTTIDLLCAERRFMATFLSSIISRRCVFLWLPGSSQWVNFISGFSKNKVDSLSFLTTFLFISRLFYYSAHFLFSLTEFELDLCPVSVRLNGWCSWISSSSRSRDRNLFEQFRSRSASTNDHKLIIFLSLSIRHESEESGSSSDDDSDSEERSPPNLLWRSSFQNLTQNLYMVYILYNW